MGVMTTGVLADSLPYVIAGARLVREYEGVMAGLVETQKLGENMGNTWDEISLSQITAQAITENTELSNYQQTADTKFTITPTMVGIATVITDKLRHRIDRKVAAKIGALAQNAIQRKKDEDLLVMLDGATTSLPGTGTTLTASTISAFASRITSNATEAGKPPIRCVLHGYQIHDLWDQSVAGVGTYPIPEGETARVFADGFRGRINQAEVYEDGNITIDTSSDAKGGVFAKEGIVLVQGMAPRSETERKPGLGGGADILYLYDDYAAGERSAGNWVYEVYSNATAPS